MTVKKKTDAEDIKKEKQKAKTRGAADGISERDPHKAEKLAKLGEVDDPDAASD